MIVDYLKLLLSLACSEIINGILVSAVGLSWRKYVRGRELE